MRNLSMSMLVASLFGANVAYAEPVIFHTETFGDQTTVTMALTSSSALLQQEYDYGVTINLVETDGTDSSVYRDNGLHKALVKCRETPGKIFVGGKEYRVVAGLMRRSMTNGKMNSGGQFACSPRSRETVHLHSSRLPLDPVGHSTRDTALIAPIFRTVRNAEP